MYCWTALKFSFTRQLPVVSVLFILVLAIFLSPCRATTSTFKLLGFTVQEKLLPAPILIVLESTSMHNVRC